jgi:hypothetical protein
MNLNLFFFFYLVMFVEQQVDVVLTFDSFEGEGESTRT